MPRSEMIRKNNLLERCKRETLRRCTKNEAEKAVTKELKFRQGSRTEIRWVFPFFILSQPSLPPWLQSLFFWCASWSEVCFPYSFPVSNIFRTAITFFFWCASWIEVPFLILSQPALLPWLLTFFFWCASWFKVCVKLANKVCSLRGPLF